jgi:hypothetical protein
MIRIDGMQQLFGRQVGAPCKQGMGNINPLPGGHDAVLAKQLRHRLPRRRNIPEPIH